MPEREVGTYDYTDNCTINNIFKVFKLGNLNKNLGLKEKIH